MTILERFEAVKNTELRTKLLRNYDPDYGGSRHEGTFDKDALQWGFSWRTAPEGSDYWLKLYNTILVEGTFDAAWNKLYPSKTSTAKTSTMVIERAGFYIPLTIRPSKPDPRGIEYGYFVVENTDNKYTVTKCDKHCNTEWSATFSEDSFLAWARDNT